MKKLFWIIILVLVLWGSWWWIKGIPASQPGSQPGTSTTTSSSTATSTSRFKAYSDPEGAFSFKYPSSFSATGRETAAESQTGWSVFSTEPGLVLARVTVPRSYLPGTNFSEAWFTVGWSNDPQAIQDCTKSQLPGVTSTNATINAQNYKKFVTSDAAAGNRYDSTIYRAILDGDCYSLEYTIHYGNIQNYDPSLGIQEFDEAKLAAELDSIAKSFEFKINSD